MGLRFDDATHQYWDDRVGGPVKLENVTTVLASGGLVDSSWCSGGEYLERGNLVHSVTAELDERGRMDMRRVPRKWRGYVRAWERFKRETACEVLEVELRVHSEQDGYAGTLDRVLKFPGVALRSIFDIKCSRTGRPADWVRYQLVAYGHAYGPGRLFDRTAATLHEDGTYAVRSWPASGWLEDLAEFRAALERTRRGNEWMRLRGRSLGGR